MTTLEKAARAVGEALFGYYEPDELRATSSSSAQAMKATKIAISAALLDPSEEICEAALDAYIDAGSLLTTDAIRAALRAAGVKITGSAAQQESA